MYLFNFPRKEILKKITKNLLNKEENHIFFLSSKVKEEQGIKDDLDNEFTTLSKKAFLAKIRINNNKKPKNTEVRVLVGINIIEVVYFNKKNKSIIPIDCIYVIGEIDIESEVKAFVFTDSIQVFFKLK